MTAIAAVVVQTLACLGFGAMVLRLLRLSWQGASLHWAVAFTIGMGLIGVLLFPIGVAGMLSTPTITLLLAAGLPGLALLPRPRWVTPRPWAMPDLALAALLGLLALGFLSQGWPPPVDGDSLAYHYRAPRQFLADGAISFIPRVVDGAIPLLCQMTYIPSLALGGEQGMTLWAVWSNLTAVLLFAAAARDWLGRRWTLVVTALLLTTPAILYSGSSGQVELRMAAFCLVGALAISRASEDGRLNWAALAGLAVGFAAASKYTALLLVAASALVLMALVRQRIAMVTVFAIMAAAAGFEWYWWNWLHTGDPVFPMMWRHIGWPVPFWNADFDQNLRLTTMAHEAPVAPSPWLLATYPFRALIGGHPNWEAGRTGLGAFTTMVLPFAIAGTWRALPKLARHPLSAAALIAALYYAAWIISAPSQRVRHLVTIYPLVLLCMTVAAERFTRTTRNRPVLATAAALALAVQVTGAVLYWSAGLTWLFGGESRETYLARYVNQYEGIVDWVNGRLGPEARVVTTFRQIPYFLNVPAFFAQPEGQALVDVRASNRNWHKFHGQLTAQGLTHLVVNGAYQVQPDGIDWLAARLQEHGCATEIGRVATRGLSSRTLGEGSASSAAILAVERDCPASTP